MCERLKYACASVNRSFATRSQCHLFRTTETLVKFCDLCDNMSKQLERQGSRLWTHRYFTVIIKSLHLFVYKMPFSSSLRKR